MKWSEELGLGDEMEMKIDRWREKRQDDETQILEQRKNETHERKLRM